MINIKQRKLNISPNLKNKINWAIKFTNSVVTIEKGSLITLEPTNLAYVEPHKLFINEYIFLFFDEQNYFFINNLNNKYKISDLEKYLKLCKNNNY